jgi:hypothetical protein
MLLKIKNIIHNNIKQKLNNNKKGYPPEMFMLRTRHAPVTLTRHI